MGEDDSEDDDEDDEMQIFINKFNLEPSAEKNGFLNKYNLHPTNAQQLTQAKSKWQEGLFHMGDLQEHKYPNPQAWVPGALPHSDYDKIENLHSLIYDHFDAHNGRFKSDFEVQEEAADAAAAKEILTADNAKFHVPE